ncbi:putative CCR4-associated factor 1 homolog 8 isoform X6 [Diospyros lotus]|uniref:putative CCR4-associated factor 1 homolog 8 isoform X4 n=1 Tax=Diospyros lotus TaxID=55363 RepID=UPI0022547219|nr:putative CCR4-associated factor 1 homolog 8 isoform X4 [Diospyros lotus]XP_052211398.1 putative CCR4-associated factor 1 homolog 8 isoform X5 [Diospyros lotus]XP_052211399.1 putative CCR4-associated factor 1 homolog 8 isoform X6 [Diospyros lotus]
MILSGSLLAGALQPVIGLPSSCCSESQRVAALLLGQFAATDSDCKVHIVQSGAVLPLIEIEMLQSPEPNLREMAAFALGRIMLLIFLCLEAFRSFKMETFCPNKDRTAKTIRRLEEKIHGRTPRHSSEEKVYEDLKYNVDQTKIVQLGLTLLDDEGNIGGTWQVNFYNFVVNEGCQGQFSFQSSPNKDNVEKNENDSLNKKNRRKRDAVDMLHFSIVFNEMLSNHEDIKWVTFHGLYDFAYLWRLLGGQELPNSASEFLVMLGRVFGSVYDVKYMARFCEGLMDGELGLERLSKILEVERLSRAHQAGSDSLLTAGVFLRMKIVYEFEEECFKGFLYGINTRIKTSCPILVRFGLPVNYHIMQCSCNAMSLPTCLPLLENLIIVQRPYDIMLVPALF